MIWAMLLAGLFGAEAEPSCMRIAIDPGTIRAKQAAAAMHALYGEAGICLALVDIPNKRIVEMIQDHRIDGEAARVSDYIDATPGLIAIPTPLSDVSGMLYWRKGWPRPRGPSVRIGYIRGYVWPPAMAAKLGLAVVEVADGNSLTKMVLAGRIDGFLMSDAEFRQMPKENDAMFDRAVVRSLNVFHSVTGDHADLVAKLDQAMKKLKADGTMGRLYESTLK